MTTSGIVRNNRKCIVPNDAVLFRTILFCKYSVLFSSYFLLSVILFVCQKGGDDMQKENNLTVGEWCDQWFTANRHKWNGNTEGGYRNLIYSHILPGIGNVALSDHS